MAIRSQGAPCARFRQKLPAAAINVPTSSLSSVRKTRQVRTASGMRDLAYGHERHASSVLQSLPRHGNASYRATRIDKAA
jgi:hypothetical protein